MTKKSTSKRHVPTETAQTAAKGERKPEIQNVKAKQGPTGGPMGSSKGKGSR